MKRHFLLPVLLLTLAACSHRQGPSADYPVYGGNKAGNRYSTLNQINLTTVKDLQPAWTYNSADSTGAGDHAGHAQEHMIQCQPIVVGGVLYGVSPTFKALRQ